MAQAVETMREELCNSGRAAQVRILTTKGKALFKYLHSDSSLLYLYPPFNQQVAYFLHHWAIWRMEHGRYHRGLPLLLEAVDMFKWDDNCTPAVVRCLNVLGAVLRSVGRLEEAEATILDAIALSTTFEDQRLNICAQCNLVEVYLEMDDLGKATQWAQKVYQELEMYQQGKHPLEQIRYHSHLMTIAEACWAGEEYDITNECLWKVGFAL